MSEQDNQPQEPETKLPRKAIFALGGLAGAGLILSSTIFGNGEYTENNQEISADVFGKPAVFCIDSVVLEKPDKNSVRLTSVASDSCGDGPGVAPVDQSGCDTLVRLFHNILYETNGEDVRTEGTNFVDETKEIEVATKTNGVVTQKTYIRVPFVDKQIHLPWYDKTISAPVQTGNTLVVTGDATCSATFTFDPKTR